MPKLAQREKWRLFPKHLQGGAWAGIEIIFGNNGWTKIGPRDSMAREEHAAFR